MSDDTTTVAELRRAVAEFVAAREWRPFHSPKNLSMSIAIEAAELMEHFQWLTAEESEAALEDFATRSQIADELADVVIYCLSMSNACGMDVSAEVSAKLARNETRFPAEEFRGRYRRPQREKGAGGVEHEAAKGREGR
jgi:NTP pyrophosphatase (non-canonical NTP hydrolase)